MARNSVLAGAPQGDIASARAALRELLLEPIRFTPFVERGCRAIRFEGQIGLNLRAKESTREESMWTATTQLEAQWAAVARSPIADWRPLGHFQSGAPFGWHG